MEAKQLRRSLECSVCFEVRRDTRIYMCVNGHDICAVCKSGKMGNAGNPGAAAAAAPTELTLCPECRVPYGDPPYRNLPVEKLIKEHLEFPCDNESDGCGFRGTGGVLEVHERDLCDRRMVACSEAEKGCAVRMKATDLKRHLEEEHTKCKYGCKFPVGKRAAIAEHEKGCGWRKVPCPGGCDSYLSFVHVMDHLKLTHKVPHLKFTCGFNWIVPLKDEMLLPTYDARCEWTHTCTLPGNQTFVRRHHRSAADGTVYIWIKMMGTREEADKFTVVIKAQGNKTEFKKECKVYPVDMADETIKEDKDCFQMSLNLMKQCLDRNPEKLTEEVKKRGFVGHINFNFMFQM